MKKFLSIILAIAICFSVSVYAAAEEGYYKEGIFSYYIRENDAILSGCDASAQGDIVIPAYVKGYPVCEMSDDAFEDCASITSITIPGTMEMIYTNGFLGTDSVQNIYVSDNNTEFKSVDGVLYDKNTNLLVNYPKGRTGAYVMPEETSGIFKGAFENSKVEEIATVSQIREIPSNAFSGCTALKKVTLSTRVESIGERAFFGCTALEEINLNRGLLSIDQKAFGHCSSLKEVLIPSSVSVVEPGAFAYCTGLEKIEVMNGNGHYKAVDGVLFNAYGDELIQYPAGSKRESYEVVQNVTKICDYAFSGCTGLKALTLHKQLEWVGDYAFDGCSGLEKLEYDGNDFQWDDIYIGMDNDVLKTLSPTSPVFDAASLGGSVIVVSIIQFFNLIFTVIAFPIDYLIKLISGEITL